MGISSGKNGLARQMRYSYRMTRPITLGELLDLLDRFEQGDLGKLNSPLPLVTTVTLLDAAQSYARQSDPLSEVEHAAANDEVFERLLEFGHDALRDEFDEEEWAAYTAKTDELKHGRAVACAEFIYPLLLDLERLEGKPELATPAAQARLALWCLSQLDYGQDMATDLLLVGIRDIAEGRDWSAPVYVNHKVIFMGEDGVEVIEAGNLNTVFGEDGEMHHAYNPYRIENHLVFSDQVPEDSLESTPASEAQEMAREVAKTASAIAKDGEDITTGLEDVAQMTLWTLRLAGATCAQERAFILALDQTVRHELKLEKPTLSVLGDMSTLDKDPKPSAGSNLEL